MALFNPQFGLINKYLLGIVNPKNGEQIVREDRLFCFIFMIYNMTFINSNSFIWRYGEMCVSLWRKNINTQNYIDMK